MTIGGIDVVLLAPAHECVGDIILRACRRHWAPEKCCFQDAEDEKRVYPLDDPWVWATGTASKEFFVFKNEAAAQSWDADGASPTNRNTMLHFIIGDVRPDAPALVEVALVCDRLTPEVKKLAADLNSAFLSAAATSSAREAA